jgi:hypothetical protein
MERRIMKLPPPPLIPAPPPVQKFVTVRCTDPSQLERFITELRTVQKKAAATGGTYAVFLPLRDGRTLQLEV